LLSLPTQHTPLNCTAAHCTVAAVSLRFFHSTLPFCLSLLADCHLPLGGHSFCSSPILLSLHDHESELQYVLHVIVVWTFVPPHDILGPVSFCCIITFFRSPKQLL